jgi:hypothetical protein
VLKAMLVKELRECGPWALAALAISGYGVLFMIGRVWPSDRFIGTAPFVQDGFNPFFPLIAAALAIGLGLRQTLGESIRGTYPLLLRLPAARRGLFAMKLLAGGGVYLVCMAAPILLYGAWSAVPGHVAAPFRWSITFPSWGIWLAGAVVYLGAFLTGVRPGSWWWSRLWPLFGALLIFWLACMLLPAPLSQWWRTTALAILALSIPIFLISIFLAAESRDF